MEVGYTGYESIFEKRGEWRNKEFFDLEERKRTAKEYIADLMQITAKEMQYMEAFEQKDYRPELLFDEQEIIENIREHPMALWKCRK